MPDPADPTVERAHQTFPELTPAEIDRIRRFGTPQGYARGTCLFEAGEHAPGMFVVLSGSVEIRQRDGLGNVVKIREQGPGQFLGEVAQLSGRPSLVDACALSDTEVLLIPPAELRALLIAEADLGERMVRALILRRVALIQSGHAGPVLVGADRSADMMRLRNFLDRNGQPYHIVDPQDDAQAADLMAQHGAGPADMISICANGSVLVNPDELALARCLGLTDTREHDELYDVAIVGAGPAGLATAVYAASEGLRVIVLDCRAYGGQAGASARIENYLGCPTGISGQALAGRAFVQAQKFGAEVLIPAQVAALDCGRVDGGPLRLTLTDGRQLRARSVVIASGAHYRRPDVARLAEFEGRGVWYWASALEARMCARSEVALVGGGNSAGQAAVFLSGHAEKVSILVRGPGLAATMSRYLIDRIAATPNIELCPHTELVALHGDSTSGLAGVTWRDRQRGVDLECGVRNVFLFVGAAPETGWLEGCGIAVDRSGFVLTGAAAGDAGDRVRAPLESSQPGVFAVGDVRSGSVKRVGGAIGEGAAAVAQVHQFLAMAG